MTTEITMTPLGLEAMDSTHDEFVELVQALILASKTEFPALYKKFLDHTQAHFDAEQQWMTEYQYPAAGEHNGEHARVLRDLKAFAPKVEKGMLMFARAYVKEQIPDWFQLHLTTMDAALALHIKARSEA